MSITLRSRENKRIHRKHLSGSASSLRWSLYCLYICILLILLINTKHANQRMSNLIFFPFVVIDLAHNDLESSNFALESKTFNLDKTNTINKAVHVMCVPQQSYP